MTCQVCNSDRLFEGEIDGSTSKPFVATTPKQSFPWVNVYASMLDATACKDCGTIVQVKLRNLEGLKKLDDIQ